MVAPAPALADDAAPLTIAVMTSTAPGSGRKTAAAIEAYTRWQAAAINRAGGVRGRPIEMVYFDDANDIAQTAANMEAALEIETLLGVVGVWSSTRGAAVVDSVGASGAPFISEISRQELIDGHPNIFSMARAAAADLPAFVKFVSDPPKRLAYFGVNDDLFTLQFKDTLERLEVADAVEVTAWEWTDAVRDLDPTYIDGAIARIRRDQPDLLVFAIGSSRGAQMLKALHDAGIDTPVYAASGSMVRMLNGMGAADYDGEMFQTRSSVPGVTNSRMAALLQDPKFVRVGAEFPPSDRSYGASYADIVAVMAEAAQGPAGRGDSLAEIRADTIAALSRTAQGVRIFRGATRDWTFDRGGSAVEPVYLLRRPSDSRALQLHNRQYAATGPGAAVNRVPIAHISFDLVQINAIDSAGQTFDAAFYVSIESEDGLTLDDFEFSNAVQSDIGADAMLSVRRLKGADRAAGMRRGTTVYKVEGRFQFEPDLSRYPFDRQSFSIQLQPADATAPLIMQPPPERLRDRAFDIPGWRHDAGVNGEYIGADNDLIYVVTDSASTARIIAFQRHSFTWVADRQSLDYYLRVVLPLTLIMMVAYLSVFIPQDRFESAVSLQVTALLSTIALYLAIPKISPDVATLSDQTFVFAEAVIVLITALSILRVNFVKYGFNWLSRGVGAVQIVVFPFLAVMMLRYVASVRSGEGETVAGKSFDEALSVMTALMAF